MKEKSTRCYDPDGFRRRAACVCVSQSSSPSLDSATASGGTSSSPQLEVLLVSAARSHERWVIPGGGIEANENPSQAAEREVQEEAGVRGHVERLLEPGVRGMEEIYGALDGKKRLCRSFVGFIGVDESVDGRVPVARAVGVFENPESGNRTTVYLLIVTEELEAWDEMKRRIRRWFPVEEARHNLMLKPRQRRYLDYLDVPSLGPNIGNGNQSR